MPNRGRCSCACLCAGQHDHSLSDNPPEVYGQATEPIRGGQIADYLRFVVLRAASSGHAQIGLFWRAVCRCDGGWPERRVFPGRRSASGVAKAAGPGVQAVVRVLRWGKVTGPGAWCWLRPGGGAEWRRPAAWPGWALRGRALGCQRGLGRWGGLVPAGGAGPVEEHGRGGGQDRGVSRDEGDLPAGHAARDDGLHRGRWRGPVAASQGGREGRTRPGPLRRRPAGRRLGRPGRRPGGGWAGMGGCGSW
jgi:hypothetical protein